MNSPPQTPLWDTYRYLLHSPPPASKINLLIVILPHTPALPHTVLPGMRCANAYLNSGAFRARGNICQPL